MKTRSKNLTNGFTLIELLVAMAITTIIVSILVSVTALSLDVWNRSRSEVRAARQGKAMIDSMARDFESLVVRKGNSFEWLYAESILPTDGPANPTGSAYKSPNAIELIFFSAATDRYNGDQFPPTETNPDTGQSGTNNGGDVSTVGYKLVYKDPIALSTPEDFKTFVLYRKLLDPDKTFGISPAQGTLGKTDLKTAFTSVIGTNTVDEATNFICENVYEFTVTFHLRVTNSLVTPATVSTVRIPITQTSTANSATKFSVTGAGNIVAGTVNGASTDQIKSAQLSAVEVSLTVLTDFGLKQFRKQTFTDAQKKAEFIAKNSYQYSKLIPVPGS